MTKQVVLIHLDQFEQLKQMRKSEMVIHMSENLRR